MVIGKFNRYFQKHGRITFMFILAVIAASMVIYIGPSMSGLGGGGMLSGGGSIGSLNGQGFTQDQLHRSLLAVGMQRGNLGNGAGSSEYTQAWPEIFHRLRWLQEAKRLGLDQVSDEELASKVQALPYLQENGAYSATYFGNLKGYLSRAGYTTDEWFQSVREQIVLERVWGLFNYGASASDVEAKLFEESSRLEGEAQIARFDSFQYFQDLKVTDDEVKAEYDTHPDTYRVGEQRAARVAVITVPVEPQPTPTDAQVEAYYQAHTADQFTTHLVNARALFRKVADDADEKTYNAAREQLEGLLKQAKGGADFVALVAKHNEDLQYKDGDLGWFNAEQRPDAAPVFTLKDKEFTGVLDCPGGLRFLQRLGGRDEVQPLADVRAKVIAGIQDEARRAKYEAAAVKQYAADLATKYKKQEVHARHILLRYFPTDDDKAKAEKRQKLEDIRKQVVGGADFASLAKEHSQDPGSAPRGGDLGFFGKGTMVKEFDTFAFSLKPNELSPVFETQFGVHLMQKLAERDTTPYSEVQAQLVDELSKADQSSRHDATYRAASAFTKDLYDALGTLKGPEALATFVKLVEARGGALSLGAGGTAKISLAETGLVTAEATSIKGFAGDVKPLVKVLFSRSLSAPLGDIVDGQTVLYLPVLTEVVAPHVPKFDDVKASASAQLRLARAKAKAREEARAKAKDVQAALDAGKPFSVAKGELPFMPSGPIKVIGQGGRDPNQDKIRDLLSKTPAGKLVADDTPSGAVVVYVVKHSVAAGGDDATFSPMYRNMARRSLIEAYDQHLLKTCDLQINPEWQFMVKPETASDASTGG